MSDSFETIKGIPGLSKLESKKWIYWRFISPNPIDQNECMNLQRKAGYDPLGYAFVGFDLASRSENGNYIAVWECYTSAD